MTQSALISRANLEFSTKKGGERLGGPLKQHGQHYRHVFVMECITAPSLDVFKARIGVAVP